MIIKKTIVIFLVATCAKAYDLGTKGAVYSIQETDARLQIKKTLLEMQKSGEIVEIQQKIKKDYLENLNNIPGKHLPNCKKYSKKNIPLKLVIKKTIKDSSGNLIFKKGDIISPPPAVNKKICLLFISGEDAQIKYALKEKKANPHIRIVLINGQPISLMQKHKTRFYFDQHGKMIERFSIQQVPSSVKRVGDRLEVESIVI